MRGLRLVYAFAPVAAAACFLVVSTALYLRQASQPTKAGSPSVAVSETVPDATEQQTKTVPATGGVQESKRTDVLPVEVAMGSTPLTARSPARRMRAASRPSREVASRSEERAELQRNTLVASVNAAQVITGRGVPFALKAPAEPMRVILRDERGEGRVVPMRAVSFGAQDLIVRENVSRQAAAENEGVW